MYAGDSDGPATGEISKIPDDCPAEDPNLYYAYLELNYNGGTPNPNGNSLGCLSASSDSNLNVGWPQLPYDSNPVRNGYKFVGWAETPDATTARYYSGNTIPVNWGKTLVLYAIWQVDTSIKPTLTIPGDKVIQVGDRFDPMDGVKAIAGTGADLTGSVQVTGSVDNTTPGTYELTYTVSDSAGNTVTAKRTITVMSTGTTIACAPQSGDPASSIRQSLTFLAGGLAFSLAFITPRLHRVIRRRI